MATVKTFTAIVENFGSLGSYPSKDEASNAARQAKLRGVIPYDGKSRVVEIRDEQFIIVERFYI